MKAPVTKVQCRSLKYVLSIRAQVPSKQGAFLVVGSKNQVVTRSMVDLLNHVPNEMDVLYTTKRSSVHIVDLSIHVHRKLIFATDTSGQVTQIGVEGETILQNVYPSVRRPGAIAVDWMEDRVMIADGRQLKSCPIGRDECVEVKIRGGLARPVSDLVVDPINGYVFYVIHGQGHGIYRIDLGDVKDVISTSTSDLQPDLIVAMPDLWTLVIVPYTTQFYAVNNSARTMHAFSLGGTELNSVHQTQHSSFKDVKSMVFYKGKFLWTNGRKILREELPPDGRGYRHNQLPLYGKPYVGMNVFDPTEQPLPAPAFCPENVTALFSLDGADIAWAPPKIPPYRGRGAWNKWTYEVFLTKVDETSGKYVGTSWTFNNIKGMNLTVDVLDGFGSYLVKVRAKPSWAQGPWSEPVVGRVVKEEPVERPQSPGLYVLEAASSSRQDPLPRVGALDYRMLNHWRGHGGQEALIKVNGKDGRYILMPLVENTTYHLQGSFEGQGSDHLNLLVKPEGPDTHDKIGYDYMTSGVDLPGDKPVQWPFGLIPYSIHGTLDRKLITKIEHSMKKIEREVLIGLESQPCVRFIKRAGFESHYLVINVHYNDTRDCSTHVQRKLLFDQSHEGPERAVLNLGLDCHTQDAMIRQLLRVLGLPYEHQRPDRDNHINVDLTNIQPLRARDFTKLKKGEYKFPNFTYDFQSIMHFSPYEAALDENSPVIKPNRKFEAVAKKLGNYWMTSTDVRKVQLLYGCEKPAQPATETGRPDEVSEMRNSGEVSEMLKKQCLFETKSSCFIGGLRSHGRWVFTSGHKKNGPRAGHSNGNDGFLIAQPSKHAVAVARTQAYDTNPDPYCVDFYMHQAGSSYLVVAVRGVNPSTKKRHVVLESYSGDSHPGWVRRSITLRPFYQRFVLFFKAHLIQGDVALDDLSLIKGPCPEEL